MKQKGKGKLAMMAATIEMTVMVAGELHVYGKNVFVVTVL